MIDTDLLQRLWDAAPQVDLSEAWPADQMRWLEEAGVLRWGIPEELGGQSISAADQLGGYQSLAANCMTTAFILTQRVAAISRVVASVNQPARERWLPKLATGEAFSTVGISHLTTSRQHLRTPAVRVVIDGDKLTLNGSIPWVTGAAHADLIVTGGTCDDGRQCLIALPTAAPGVSVDPHAHLLALTASHTATVQLENVELSAECLLAGPVENLMSAGKGGGTGSLTTSFLALGLAQRVQTFLVEQEKLRPDLQPVVRSLVSEIVNLHLDMNFALTHPDETAERYSAASIRQRVNSLAVRVSQAALGISKGAGFVRGHVAERSVREAMFFLVWSCPQPVVQGGLEELVCRGNNAGFGPETE